MITSQALIMEAILAIWDKGRRVKKLPNLLNMIRMDKIIFERTDVREIL